jgi:hypothetical protein
VGVCSMVSPICHGCKGLGRDPNNTYECILADYSLSWVVGCRLVPIECLNKPQGSTTTHGALCTSRGFVAWFHPCAMGSSDRTVIQMTHISVYQLIPVSHG